MLVAPSGAKRSALPIQKEQMDTKECRICQTTKPLSEYYYRKDSGKHRSECAECLIELTKYRAYGVCNVKYDEMLVKQHGGCAICGSKFDNTRFRKLSIDHDHRTGAVRGLLCSNCNTSLGLMKDSPERLQAAIDYLNRFGSKDIV